MTETPNSTHSENETFPITSINKIRVAKRANYDKDTLFAILDEGLIAQVGFVLDDKPIVLPMAYGRIGDQIYIHGAKAARMLKALKKGVAVCLNVTLVDGLVLGRAAFHHTMNFRSANIHGTARLVEDEKEKYDALVAVTDHLAPGRWDETRETTAKEIGATTVIAVTIEQAASKIRAGMPIDDEADYGLDHWAGIVPISTSFGPAINDARLKEGVPVAKSIRKLTSRR
jgi:nitroimidazol reductase NimA-like FMN-containing flavoprotein (pyridoxamine 5'-phosphate oxidase superfamily)